MHFTSRKDHDDTIIANYNSLVRKRDTVFFLGDICFTKDSLDLIKALPGDKRLVLGNHDNQYNEFDDIELYSTFNKVYSLHSRKGCWLSHAPIHPEELRGKYNIHGHTHSFNIKDSRYANVSLENCNYYPADFQEIKSYLDNGFEFTKR